MKRFFSKAIVLLTLIAVIASGISLTSFAANSKVDNIYFEPNVNYKADHLSYIYSAKGRINVMPKKKQPDPKFPDDRSKDIDVDDTELDGKQKNTQDGVFQQVEGADVVLKTPEARKQGFIEMHTAARSEGEFDVIYIDGDNYITYKLPIKADATLVLKCCQNYSIDISANGTTFRDKKVSEGGVDNDTNLGEVAWDLKAADFPQGFVYVRFGDQSTNNGNGGVLYSVWLSYDPYMVPPPPPKPQPGESFKFIPGDANEATFAVTLGGQLSNGYRFCDGGNAAIYKIPVDQKKESTISFTVAANYAVKVSSGTTDKDGLTYYATLVLAPGGKGVAGMGPENIRMYTYKTSHIIDLIKKENPDVVTDTSNLTEFFFKVGDQTPANGHGGQLHMFSLSYGDVKSYNPFSPLPKLTGIRYSRPQRVNMLVKRLVTSTEYITSTVYVDAPSYDVSDEYSSVEEVSSEIIESSSEMISSDVSSVYSQAEVPQTQDEKVDNTPFYVLIGVIAALLIGAAVAQFIIMEKKRNK